ncbi:MAG: hypothetical protein ACYTFQ_31235, partial [Planctomycetota bacterium]
LRRHNLAVTYKNPVRIASKFTQFDVLYSKFAGFQFDAGLLYGNFRSEQGRTLPWSWCKDLISRFA